MRVWRASSNRCKLDVYCYTRTISLFFAIAEKDAVEHMGSDDDWLTVVSDDVLCRITVARYLAYIRR